MPFLLLFDMGLLIIGTREIAFAAGREQTTATASRESHDVIGTFLRFRGARAATLLMILGSVAAFSVLVGLIPAKIESANVHAILICALSSGLVLSTYTYQGFLEGTGNYHLDRMVSAGTVLLSGLAVGAAAYLSHSFWWVIGAWYGGQAATLATKAIVAHRVNPRIHTMWRVAPREVGATFKQSFSVFLLQLGAALTKYVQYPIITEVLGLAALSTYFFVVRIASTFDQAISVLNASQRAIFSQLLAAGKRLEARRLMLSVLAQVATLSGVSAVVVIFILPPFVALFTSHGGLSRVPFWVIGLDLISMSTSGMMSQFVIASGRNPFAKVVLLAGVLTIGLLSFLVPRYGLLGAALGQFVANLLTNLGYSAWHFRKLSQQLKNVSEGPDYGSDP
jgi:O-antigen/teichoic acid export membrane protein